MSRLSPYILTIFLVILFLPAAGWGLVQVGKLGEDPLSIEDVYQREGTSFVAIGDVLKALELDGEWDSVEHVYRIRTPHGWAVISPGSQFLRLGDNFVPIAQRPRFIDGKLRVSEPFILKQLAPLLADPIYYRNHNPATPAESEDPLDRLFAFLLRKKDPVGNQGRRVVAIDPGHGGQDPGAIGLKGSKEKTFNLAVGQRLEKLLKMHQDAPVILTRNDDYEVALAQRLEIVGNAGADVMLSLHAQTFWGEEPQGIMLYIQPQAGWGASADMFDDSSLSLAKALQVSLKNVGFTVDGIRELPVLPLGQGDLPRVLVEMGNLGNLDDLSLLENPTRQQDLARALFEGLQQFFSDHKETSQ